MKTLLTCVFAIPLIAACTTPVSQDDASYLPRENVYSTGSNLPSKQAKSNVQTLTPEQASQMMLPVAPRGPKN